MFGHQIKIQSQCPEWCWNKHLPPTSVVSFFITKEKAAFDNIGKTKTTLNQTGFHLFVEIQEHPVNIFHSKNLFTVTFAMLQNNHWSLLWLPLTSVIRLHQAGKLHYIIDEENIDSRWLSQLVMKADINMFNFHPGHITNTQVLSEGGEWLIHPISLGAQRDWGIDSQMCQHCSHGWWFHVKWACQV